MLRYKYSTFIFQSVNSFTKKLSVKKTGMLYWMVTGQTAKDDFIPPSAGLFKYKLYI